MNATVYCIIIMAIAIMGVHTVQVINADLVPNSHRVSDQASQPGTQVHSPHPPSPYSAWKL